MYVIINTKGKRVKEKKGDKLIITPAFKYPIQAYNYIAKRLGNPHSVNIKKI